jgi:hypothetical protein
VEKIEYIVTDFHSPDSKCRGSLADLVLDSIVIPPCGLIPPYKVLRSVLRTGGASAGMSPGCIWQPFELSEAEYWQIVEKLASFTAEDVSMRHRNPQITGEIRPDYGAPEMEDYQVWLESLVNRGFLPKPFRKARR